MEREVKVEVFVWYQQICILSSNLGDIACLWMDSEHV